MMMKNMLMMMMMKMIMHLPRDICDEQTNGGDYEQCSSGEQVVYGIDRIHVDLDATPILEFIDIQGFVVVMYQ